MNGLIRSSCVLGLMGLTVLTFGCARHATEEPLPLIYGDLGAPEPRIAAAQESARQTGKRVLLNFGADWCGDSRALHRRFEKDEEIAQLLQDHYVEVRIDVGERGGALWNAPVVQQYGKPFARHGIPALVVLGEDGTPLFTPDETPLRDSDHRRPRKLRRFLREWAAPGVGTPRERTAKARRSRRMAD